MKGIWGIKGQESQEMKMNYVTKMSGLYRQEQLGDRHPSPWAEGFRVGGGRACQQGGPCNRYELRDTGAKHLLGYVNRQALGLSHVI